MSTAPPTQPSAGDHASWSGAHVSSAEVADRLRQLHHDHALRTSSHAATRTLNLLVAPGADAVEVLVEAWLTALLPRHPARTIVLREHPNDRLDAEVELHCDAGEPDRAGACGQCHDAVTLLGDAQRLSYADSLVRPLLIGGLPTVLWLPGGESNPAEEPLTRARVAGSVVLDTDVAPSGVVAAFARAARLGETADVLDLAWMRLVAWRQRVAESFDARERHALLPRADRLEIDFSGREAAGPLLLAGWFAARAGWIVTRIESEGEDGRWCGGALRPDGGRVELVLGGEAESDGVHGLTVSAGEELLQIDQPASEPDPALAFSAALGRADAGAGAPGYAPAVTAIARGLAAA